MNGHNSRTWRVFLASLAILAMVAAACGGGDKDDGDGGGGGAAECGEPGEHTGDAAQAEIGTRLPTGMKPVGISADTIEVGYLLSASRSAEAAGIQRADLEVAQARQQFWVDYVNKSGGVAG